MVTVAERNAYVVALNSAREPCPRCASSVRSSACALCSGKNHVPPAVAAMWLSQHPTIRRPSRPEMKAVVFDPRKEES
jgi:hypothetical protein